MRPVIRVYLYDENGERFFGEGPLRLLHAVEETGSLRSAAQSMEMAYTKALHLLRRAEKPYSASRLRAERSADAAAAAAC